MALTPWNRQEEWYQEMIDAIGEGGGGGLPEVTSEDKGKYLHVNDSTGDLEWATAGGSGGGVLVVTLGSQGELNASYNELDSAIKSGKIVMFYDGDETHSVAFHLSSIGIDDREGIYLAIFVNYGIGGAEFVQLSANDANTKLMA